MIIAAICLAPFLLVAIGEIQESKFKREFLAKRAELRAIANGKES